MFHHESATSAPRIALVTGCLNLGGSTTFLINFAGELSRRGMPVEVFCFERENPLAVDFEKQNVRVLCLDERRQIFEDRLRLVLNELARFQPTVVISTLGASSFEVLRYVPAGIIRVGMGQSDDAIVYDMMCHYPPCLDRVAMVSRAMKAKAEALPEFARVPVEYLPYGVPMCPESELPARTPNAPVRILYLGRLWQEQKRVRLFPEIFRELQASRIPFHWTIAGTGPEREFLETNLKSTTSNQTVSFTGSVDYAGVPTLLKSHDIFLLASDYEGLPLSLLEAMGYGLVPVVSDLASGIPEVVDATNGLLVAVNDTAGYARAIIHLHQHRGELAAKSAAARARVAKDFSVAAMTDRWLAVLPQPKETIGPWPQRWRIHAPLPAPNWIYFSSPVRVLRKLALRFRDFSRRH